MLQLNPPIPLDTPDGPGLAHFVINDGIEHDLFWVVALDKPKLTDRPGECWTYRNSKIHFQENITWGRVIRS